MNDHLSDSQILMFQARASSSAEMIAALEHLAQCLHCRQRSHEHFQASNAYQVSTISLSPALQWRHEHLDAEQITALVNKSLDSEDEEIAQAHLQTCSHCRAEVQDWLAFQRELQTELRTRYGPKPATNQTWQWPWRTWEWKPIFATLLGTACVLMTIGLILYQVRRPANPPLVTASPAPTASAITPSPIASPEIPLPSPEKPAETVIASLRDGAGMIALTKEGEVEGIPSLSEELRGDIANALRTGKLNQPALLHDLAIDAGTVRGNPADNAPAQLLTPLGITVLTNRPILHWQPVKGATGYEVQIADGRGHEVAQSETLPASTSRWQLPKALKRGVIYTWTVRAIHAEPTATAIPPTGRFKVLEASKAQELVRLKKQANSHLVLGLFYAREGMLPEAKQELQSLANKNPDSPLVRKLLRTVQAWR